MSILGQLQPRTPWKVSLIRHDLGDALQLGLDVRRRAPGGGITMAHTEVIRRVGQRYEMSLFAMFLVDHPDGARVFRPTHRRSLGWRFPRTRSVLSGEVSWGPGIWDAMLYTYRLPPDWHPSHRPQP